MRRALIVAFFLLIGVTTAFAQSPCQYIAPGAILTAGQWQDCFSAKQDAGVTYGTGLGVAGTVVSSNAESTNSFSTGTVTSVSNTIGAFTKWAKASTVDNIVGSALTFTCSGNPTVTFYECGASLSCSGPTTIGSVTLTAAGAAVLGTISSSAIAAGHYTAWAVSAGTCSALNIAGTAQVHSN